MKDKIKELGERAKDIKDQLKTEESVKHALVLPFLGILGYNVYDPREVVPEFTADVAVKNGEKVDYAIMKDGVPVLLVECKHHTEDLSKHGNQLFRYYSCVGDKKIGILTNGYRYMFFSDLEKKNLKDKDPFFEFDITNMYDSQYEELARFQKSALDMDKIADSANILKHTNTIKNILRTEFSEPTEDFIRYLVKRAGVDVLTQKKYSFFEPLAKKSIKQILDEIFTSRLNKVLNQQKEQVLQEKEKEQTEENAYPDDGIITTEEELAGLAIIKAIVCSIVPLERVSYKDTKRYFGINLDGNVKKTFCRLYFGKTKMSITTTNEDYSENRIEIENLEDIYQHAEVIREAVKRFAE